MWIEPATGQIIDQEQHDVRAIDGKNLLDVQLSFTDDQVSTNAEDAKSNKSSLDLLTHTVPIIGFVGGIVLILLGVALVVMSRRSVRQGRPRQGRSGGLGLAAQDERLIPGHGARVPVTTGFAPGGRHRVISGLDGGARARGWGSGARGAGVPRRSRCRACSARGCPTSRPRPGRGPRATRARAGR